MRVKGGRLCVGIQSGGLILDNETSNSNGKDPSERRHTKKDLVHEFIERRILFFIPKGSLMLGFGLRLRLGLEGLS